MADTVQLYQYEPLRTPTAFRVAELHPGKGTDEIRCTLHQVDWSNLRDYEAISYTWGDPNVKASIIVEGTHVLVTKNLAIVLTHLRYEDRPRYVWADALCINQSDIPERGAQVKQMRRIYQEAKTVLIWIGPDNDLKQASLAFDAVLRITHFLSEKLNINFDTLVSEDAVYHKIIFQNRGRFPLPHECDFMTDEMWAALLWLYKHPYFTRVWVIQEINANKSRLAHCGNEVIPWDAVELVAGYIILDTTFSRSHGFTDSYCWWASTAPADLLQPDKWLHMLYLASNFAATDPRDVVYGLRGLMNCREGGELLDPDYSKDTTTVFRDAVEASLINFKKPDATLYVSGVEDPSWVPRWDVPMLFRNPFRFGEPVPWKPAGDTQAVWSIDRAANILSLTGILFDRIEHSATYYDSFFGPGMRDSETGREKLRKYWDDILDMLAKVFPAPFSESVFTAMADSLSFGMNDKIELADRRKLLHNLVQYLQHVVSEDTCLKYISPEISSMCQDGDADLFGKPVWDFEYPASSIFVSKDGRVGCCMAATAPGDAVFIPLGAAYPLVLKPDGDRYRIRGFCFVHGVMQGEHQGGAQSTVEMI